VQAVDTSESVNVGSWLARRAASQPERAAVIVEGTGQVLSYAALDDWTNRVAAALASRGVGEGTRVAIALRSEPLYLALYFACARLGAISVPLNTRLTAHELAFQLDDCRPRVVVRDASVDLGRAETLERQAFLQLVPAAAAAPGPLAGGERPQTILYTSGTTGRPKGALLPHRKTLYNTLNAEIYLGLHRDDIVVAPIPLFHSFGLKILSVPALFAGATLVLVDRFDPHELQRCIARRGATILGAVPVMYRRMLEGGLQREPLSSLRYAFSAGAPLDVETIHAWARHGVRITQGYGQTETSILCCLGAPDALTHAGSVGRPVRHGELRVADPQGNSVPPGTPGEIVVRGPIVMLGYWERPEETAASRIDGWHRTGDLGVMDEEGFVTLVGRRKELYISGGENVYPAEVERALSEHPDVIEVAVVGVPDARWGEAGRAYVVSRGARDAEQLLTWARERLARYKIPREVVWLDELPRTASGKVPKHVLLERHP
jgi:acyl-CoA synthetase (AMP-forming)/AMP-acid ligase II